MLQTTQADEVKDYSDLRWDRCGLIDLATVAEVANVLWETSLIVIVVHSFGFYAL